MSQETDLKQQRCQACEGGVDPLDERQVRGYLEHVPGWELADERTIRRGFTFKDYYQVMAFVNAVAWIAHREDHHPDMEVGFKDVTVRYTTHAIGGLSPNDFICAAKVNALGE